MIGKANISFTLQQCNTTNTVGIYSFFSEGLALLDSSLAQLPLIKVLDLPLHIL